MGTTARFDRFALTLLGLLLTAGGVLALVAGFGGFGSELRNEPYLQNDVSTFFGDQGAWLWPVIALVLLVIAYLAFRWLRGQLRPTGVGEVELEPSGREGRTTVDGSAVTDAVTQDIESYRGVSRASARLSGSDAEPELKLRISLDERADIAAVRERIESQAVARARQALDNPQLPVQIDLVATDKKAARVS